MAMTCSDCGDNQRKRLCDDEPGVHSYILVCDTCGREEGPEWVEHHRNNFLTIHITGSAVSTLNLGSVLGDMRSADTILVSAGQHDLAAALRTLSQAIERSSLPPPSRHAASELLSALGDELAKPNARRRPSVLRAVGAQLWALLRSAADLTGAYEGFKISVRLTAGIDLP